MFWLNNSFELFFVFIQNCLPLLVLHGKIKNLSHTHENQNNQKNSYPFWIIFDFNELFKDFDHNILLFKFMTRQAYSKKKSRKN